MRVFLSWSKPLSGEVASILRDWLPDVIQALEPWMSSEDIHAGDRWSGEIAKALADTGQGVIIVTAVNQRESWLNFEAGALAKSLSDGQPRPLLVDLKHSEVVGPLTQFQMTEARNREEMLRLLTSLNEALPQDRRLATDRLERLFSLHWPTLEKRLDAALKAAEARQQQPTAPTRSPEDLLEELLELVRSLDRRIRPTPAAQPATPADVVEALVERARIEGRLSLEQLRASFDAAGIGPTEARQVLRELSEQGAVVSEDLSTARPVRNRRKVPPKEPAS